MRLLSDCRPAVLGASLVPQQVKNPPAMQETLETWIRSLSWEDLLEEENGNLLQCSCLKNPMDSRVTNRWTWLSYRCTCRPTVFKAFPSHSESSFLSKTYEYLKFHFTNFHQTALALTIPRYSQGPTFVFGSQRICKSLHETKVVKMTYFGRLCSVPCLSSLSMQHLLLSSENKQ